jgi:hypothetical protein
MEFPLFYPGAQAGSGIRRKPELACQESSAKGSSAPDGRNAIFSGQLQSFHPSGATKSEVA